MVALTTAILLGEALTTQSLRVDDAMDTRSFTTEAWSVFDVIPGAIKKSIVVVSTSSNKSKPVAISVGVRAAELTPLTKVNDSTTGVLAALI